MRSDNLLRPIFEVRIATILSIVAAPAAVGFPFKIEKQERTKWCWVACAVSIARKFDPTFSRKQCEVVEKVLGLNDCCKDSACNETGSVDDALREVGHYGSTASPPIEADILQLDLSSGKPVAFLTNDTSVVDHFVVVHFYDPVNGSIVGKDPADGTSFYPQYDSFRNNCKSSHRSV